MYINRSDFNKKLDFVQFSIVPERQRWKSNLC